MERPESYGDLVRIILEDYGYTNDNFVDSGDYYLLHNPFTEDNGSKSSTIYKNDGNFRSYNSQISIMRGGVEVFDTSLSLTEWIRLIGKMDIYIDYLWRYNGHRKYELDLYKDYIYDCLFRPRGVGEYTPYEKRKFNKIRKELFKFYITDYDLFYESEGKVSKINNKTEKTQTKKATITIEKNEYADIQSNKYLQSRKLPPRENVYGVKVIFQSGKTNALCIEYPNGFKKLRMLNNRMGLRYLAFSQDGKYEQLLPVQSNMGTKKAWIVEGELDSMSLSGLIKHDIFALHNVNSIPKSEDLSMYTDICVKLDTKDTEKNKDIVLNKLSKIFDGNITVEPKTKDNRDYNDCLIDGSLTELLKEMNNADTV